MPGGGLTVEITALGETHIKRRIMRVGDRAAGSAEAVPLWLSVWDDLLLIEQVQFLTQGRGKWASLADSTTAEKARKNQPSWIERATEALFQSLTSRGDSDQIKELTGSWMRFGTRLPYAVYQQRGTSKMPQRKLIDLKEVERRAIVKSIQLFLLTGEVRSISAGV